MRSHFPIADRTLYLDAALQTPLSLPVRAALDAFYDSSLVNAGPKRVWLARAEEVRARLAALIGAAPDEVAFTKNTSEGLNIYVDSLVWEPGDNVLLVAGEHPNHVRAWQAKRAAGLEVRIVPGADTFAPHIDARTRAIGLSHVMFHNGQRNDVAGIVELAGERAVEVVVDATQSVGVLAVDVGALGASAVAAGVHKGLLTPHGLGFLHVPGGAGRRFEHGNLNLAAIHALGAALDLLDEIGIARVEEHVLALGDQLIAVLDDLGIGLVGPRERRRRSHIYVLDLEGPKWPRFFAERGVRLSSVPDGIRVSFGVYSNADDVARFGDVLRRGLRA